MNEEPQQQLDLAAWRRAQLSIQAAAEALAEALALSPALSPVVSPVTTHDTPNAALRTLREVLGLSQARVGELRGVHPNAHAKIERATDLRWSTMVAIAKALDARVTLTFRGPDGETFTVSEAP